MTFCWCSLAFFVCFYILLGFLGASSSFLIFFCLEVAGLTLVLKSIEYLQTIGRVLEFKLKEKLLNLLKIPRNDTLKLSIIPGAWVVDFKDTFNDGVSRSMTVIQTFIELKTLFIILVILVSFITLIYKWDIKILSFFSSLINKFLTFLKKKWPNVFIIFSVGFTSRIIVNNYFNVNVFIDYLEPVSIIFYSVFSFFTVFVNGIEFNWNFDRFVKLNSLILSVLKSLKNVTLQDLSFKNLYNFCIYLINFFKNGRDNMPMVGEECSSKVTDLKKDKGMVMKMKNSKGSSSRNNYRATRSSNRLKEKQLKAILSDHDPEIENTKEKNTSVEDHSNISETKQEKKKRLARIIQKRHRDKNSEKYKEINKKYRENNPNYFKEYYEDNKQKIKDKRQNMTDEEKKKDGQNKRSIYR